MKSLWAFCFSYQFHMVDVEIKTCFMEERGSQTGQRSQSFAGGLRRTVGGRL